MYKCKKSNKLIQTGEKCLRQTKLGSKSWVWNEGLEETPGHPQSQVINHYGYCKAPAAREWAFYKPRVK